MRDARAAFRMKPPIDGTFTFAGLPTDTTRGATRGKAELALEGGELGDALDSLQDRLMAQDQRRVLLVLQGLDASGKGGTVRHVVGVMNPAGVRVVAFQEPTEQEAAHHFLWRIRKELPSAGELVVFDRSHYEDLVVPVALDEASARLLERRIADVNRFERELVDAGTIVVKCFLHLSYDEQRERFLRRLRRDDKRWKFKESDLDTRDRWDEHLTAYATALQRTHTDEAPWHIVPADHKWYRNWAVARLLVETLEVADLHYPQPDLDVRAIERRLEGLQS